MSIVPLDYISDSEEGVRKSPGEVVIAAAVFDLDGTLAPLDCPIPNDVISRLNSLSDREVQIVICSGKPVGYLGAITRQGLLKNVILIGENGGYLQSNAGRRSLLPDGTDTTAISSIFSEIRSKICKSEMFSDRLPEFQEGTINLTVFFRNQAERKVIAVVLEDYRPAWENFCIKYEHADSLELVPNGVSKKKAIKILAEMLGIDMENVIAIGDGENDIPMFEVAGTSIEIVDAQPRYNGKNHHVVRNIYDAMDVIDDTIDEMIAIRDFGRIRAVGDIT